jgi:hypothetical protein
MNTIQLAMESPLGVPAEAFLVSLGCSSATLICSEMERHTKMLSVRFVCSTHQRLSAGLLVCLLEKTVL